MKNFISVLWALLASAAVSANPVSPKQAREIASGYVRAGVSPRMVKRQVAAAATENDYQPLYVFSRGAGEGYVLVSGDDRLPAIIGVADSGDFDEAQLPIQLKDMIDYYTAAAEQLQKGGREVLSTEPRRAAGKQNIATLMTSHHNQGWPYNNLCPYITNTRNRAVTGCVATAASQIIYYWRKDLDDRTKYNTPTYGYGDAPVTETIPSGTPLKWNLMQDSYAGNDPEECQTAVATLVACVGASAWLTYGSSTSGQIDNCRQVFSGQFGMNGGTTVWKSSYSQTNWERLIINDLEAGFPILYSGVHPSNGGHAVVIDGYRLSDNLFHFNFGWGGQGDGYYTVDDATGMNGFNGSQGMVINISPRKYNVTGKLTNIPEKLISRVGNTFRARVTNNSTLPQKGFSVYCMSGTATPSGTATDTDKETVLGIGETADFTFTVTPTGTTKYTIYLCDANRNVLDKVTFDETMASVPALTLNGLSLDDGGTSETLTIGGETVEVHHIYNTRKANVTANFTNGEQGTLCTPSVQGVLDVLENGEFVKSTTRTKKNVTFAPGSTEDIIYDLTALTDGSVYKFYLAGTASTNRSFDINYATEEKAVYFKLMGRNLEATPNEEGNELVLTGNFNAMAFAALTQDEQISRYDLTQVTNVVAPLEAANKNALFYVASGSTAAGRNIVADGVVDELDLTPGYNFKPREDFFALHATYHANQAVGQYGTLYIPFDAETPSGMFARKVNQVRTSYLQEVDSCNLQLKGGTPYIILTGEPVSVTAENVAVSTQTPSEGTDTLRGTWTNMEGTAGQYVIDDASNQYFSEQPGTIIPALTAYLEYTRRVRVASAGYSAKDKKAQQLAQQISATLQIYEQYVDQTSEEAKEALREVLSEACEMLRTQPIAAQQTMMINDLKAAAEAYVTDATRVAENGLLNMTNHIQNPSFELGSMRNWTYTASAINRITSARSLYMSGADGSYVARISAGGNISQTLTGLENGTYQMEVQVAADYDHHISVFAGTDTLEVESTDFGPMYMTNCVLKNIEVTDGTLTIGAQSVEDWVKVDNFRLYQVSRADGIEALDASAQGRNRMTEGGVYDLSGRRVVPAAKGLRPSAKGIYISDGKKVVISK